MTFGGDFFLFCTIWVINDHLYHEPMSDTLMIQLHLLTTTKRVTVKRNTPASVLDFSLCIFRNCCRKLPSFTNLFDEDDDEDDEDACDGGELRERHRSTNTRRWRVGIRHMWCVKSPDGFVLIRVWFLLALFSQLGLYLSFLLSDQFLLLQDHIHLTVLMRFPTTTTWHNVNIVKNETELTSKTESPIPNQN